MRTYLQLGIISSLLVFGCAAMASYEEPTFKLIESYKNIEIRAYEPMIVAKVEVSGERGVAIKDGFRLIADYIFGNNQAKEPSKTSSEKIPMTTPVIQQKNEKIPMTTPVIQQQNQKIPMTTPVTQQGKNNNWLVEFVMPKSYTLETLPKPNNPQVQLIEVPAYKAVVIRFSGMSSQTNLKKHLAELNDFVTNHKINVVGEPIYAFYNPPWTLPFLRRNEIMLKLTD